MALFSAVSYSLPCKGSCMHAHKLSRYSLVACIFLLVLLVFGSPRINAHSPVINAQTPPSDTAADQTGVQPFGSFGGGGKDGGIQPKDLPGPDTFPRLSVGPLPHE